LIIGKILAFFGLIKINRAEKLTLKIRQHYVNAKITNLGVK